MFKWGAIISLLEEGSDKDRKFIGWLLSYGGTKLRVRIWKILHLTDDELSQCKENIVSIDTLDKY